MYINWKFNNEAENTKNKLHMSYLKKVPNI